jgi:mono/diheme cytochrome c family protein
VRGIAAGALAVALSGCMWEGWARAPEPGLERMIEQPRVDAYESTEVLPGGLALQSAPEGTSPFAREEPPSPPQLTLASLGRGRASFEIHCAPCHGLDGRAETPIAEDMTLRAPPSLSSADVVSLTDARIARVIREGFGLMPSYAVALDDVQRGEVVAYVRALQLRDRVRVASLPLSMQRELEAQR